VSRPTEDGLIARYFAPLAGPGGLGLADDAALLAPSPSHDLVLTVDGLVAGVHFFPGDPPGSIARKALGVNLSDLAAKGARPLGYLLTLALPSDWSEPWLAAFSAGLGEAAREAGCSLLGGDTVRASGALSLSITAIGEVPSCEMVRRTTAEPGDRICVTGTIGDAVLGLALLLEPDAAWAAPLSGDERATLVDRYHHPRARLALAPALRAYARAAMDVSDGLVGDAAKMMRASGVSAAIDLAAVPFSAAACRALAHDPLLRDRMVCGGDDYEILACIPPGDLPRFLHEARRAGIPVAVIGDVVAGSGAPTFSDETGLVTFAQGSFSHF
jgi:thiamine-monophosphate kinase